MGIQFTIYNREEQQIFPSEKQKLENILDTRLSID